MEIGANIIMIAYSAGTPRNHITEYGRLNVEDIKTSFQHFIGQHKLQSHNYVQLFH